MITLEATLTGKRYERRKKEAIAKARASDEVYEELDKLARSLIQLLILMVMIDLCF